MSSFELNELGSGRFELTGDMSFHTADRILRASATVFAEQASIEVDLSNVEKADSAGLALLLEWKALANQRAAEIRFTGVPESLLAIARTTDVSDLL